MNTCAASEMTREGSNRMCTQAVILDRPGATQAGSLLFVVQFYFVRLHHVSDIDILFAIYK